MSQLNSMAIPMEGKYSKSELLELKNKMNAKALAKRRSKTALRLAANIIFAILVLLPLLYAVSIALMPSNELFTTDLNLFPKHPTLQNFKEAFTTVPLLRFILNSFIMAGCITIGQIKILTEGGPNESTNVIVYSIYRDAFFNYRFGSASAQSVILFVIIMLVTLVMFRIEKKGVNY